MKSKNIFLTTILILVINGISLSDEMLLYSKAFSFIQSSDFIKETYTQPLLVKPDTNCAFVSEDVITFDPNLFIYDILNYEFKDCIKMNKNIETYLKLAKPEKFKIKIGDMLLLNNNGMGNILVFFSEVVGHKLIARIKIYDDHYPPFYSYFSGYGSGDNIYFLFYFNEDNEIEKVFSKHTSG